LKLEIKKLQAAAVIPSKPYNTDAGLDLTIPKNYKIVSDSVVTLGTGIAVNIPKGYCGLIKGRSSASSDNLLYITGGLIDAGYQGEIKIIVSNTSSIPIFISAGSRIAQLVILKLPVISLAEVKDFTNSTERGEKGFGSSN